MLILSPIPKQFLDESGIPYTNGTVSIYLHGDTELADVYVDPEGTALIQNPCILDSHGMWQGFVDPDKPLDYIVKDSEGNVITRFCNISLPTGDDIPEVKVISSDGSINVDETLENGERVFDITVNDDMMRPSCAKFFHEAVNGGGEVSFDSFELEGDPDRDIYLADGVITLAEGVYHISANFVIGNDECHNEYFGITVNFGDCSTAKVWDRSFVHEESVEFGLDIVADVDGYTVVPTIAELPDDMHCSVSRLYIHKVSGSGVGVSMASVEHDGTLVGDGTHNDPLGVKDWSEIRTTLENTTNELLDHETANDAHQDIRDELERKEDKDNKVTSWGSTPSDEKYPSEKLVKDTIDNLPPGTAVKGDAESEYRTGNVNLTPANIGAATASQGDKADTAVQGVKVNGTELSKDGNNKVDVPVPTASTATPLKDGTASAGSSSQWARGDHRHPTDDSREAVANKVQSIDDSSTTEYPSSKAVADFVNSSVATNTATFLGNFKLPDLGLAYPATEVQIAAALNSHTWPTGFPTNNDYVYVEIQDPQSTIDDKVQRYKYRDVLASWGYEYTLNNSSFTAEEKAAIDSGITSQDVTNLRADHTTLDTHIADTSNPHNVTKSQVGLGNVDNTSDANKPVSTAQQTALNAKQDAISDLATIRSGATAGASALQPSGNGSNLSVTPDGTSTGYDLGSSTTLKAFAQKFKNLVSALKALAFKDKASYNDLSSGVQSSLDKADSALQSHQSVTDNNPTLAWGTTSKVGKVGSTDLRVTMPANPAIGTLAKADASISVDGLAGNRWYKVAESSFTSTYGNKSGSFEINYTDSDWNITTLFIDFNVRSQNENKPFAISLTAVATKVLSVCDVRIVSRGAISSRKLEIWVKCGVSESRSSVLISEHASGGYLYNTTSTFTFTSYSATAGQAEPTTDETNNVYVYTPTINRVPSVINNLTSDSTTDALSAAQGKALNDAITKVPILGSVSFTTFIGYEQAFAVNFNDLEAGGNIEVAATCTHVMYSYGVVAEYQVIINIKRQGDTYTFNADYITKYKAREQIHLDLQVRQNTSSKYLFLYVVANSVPNYESMLVRIDRATNWNGLKVSPDIITIFNIAAIQGTPSWGTLVSDGNDFNLVRSVGGNGSPSTPVYVDSDGRVRPCTASNTLKSNTATLYIAGTFGEGNIPYYNVKDIANGCVNYVHVKDIPYNTCSITIEAPALASGEEYDYVVVFDTFTNSNLIGSIDVENCKTAGHMDNGVFVVDSMILSSANPHYVPMIVVKGNVASSKWYDRT